MNSEITSRVIKETFRKHLDVLLISAVDGKVVEIELGGGESVYLVSNELFTSLINQQKEY